VLLEFDTHVLEPVVAPVVDFYFEKNTIASHETAFVIETEKKNLFIFIFI
jgi:hypothetical protein